jgi:hypothetical protein
VWLWLATAACTVPVVQPLPERQDPARFEACDQPAAQAAYKQALVHLQAGEDEAALPLLRSVVGVCKENVVAHCRYQDVALRLGGAAEAAMREFYASIEPVRNSPVPGARPPARGLRWFRLRLAVDGAAEPVRGEAHGSRPMPA